MLHYFPGEAAALPFQVPTSSCCNCGRAGELELVATPFKHTRYMLLAGTELSFELELPYCAGCRRTAKRFRQGIFSKILVGLGLFFPLLLGSTFIPRELTKGLPDGWMGWGSASVVVAVSLVFFVFPRVKPPRTSRYQPVFLRKLGQTFSGQITSLALAFTNASYAEEFARLNQDAISEGVLKVVVKR